MHSKCLSSLAMTIVLATSLLPAAAQFDRPGSTETGQSRGGTPPNFPTDSHLSSTMPPDTAAPPSVQNSNFKVAGQIRAAMAQEQRLTNCDVSVDVTDARVTVAGHVSDNDDRYLALRIAYDYVGTRTLVDKLLMGNER